MESGTVLKTNPLEIFVETYKGFDIIWCAGITGDDSYHYAIPEGKYGIAEPVAERVTLNGIREMIDSIVGVQKEAEKEEKVKLIEGHFYRCTICGRVYRRGKSRHPYPACGHRVTAQQEISREEYLSYRQQFLQERNEGGS